MNSASRPGRLNTYILIQYIGKNLISSVYYIIRTKRVVFVPRHRISSRFELRWRLFLHKYRLGSSESRGVSHIYTSTLASWHFVICSYLDLRSLFYRPRQKRWRYMSVIIKGVPCALLSIKHISVGGPVFSRHLLVPSLPHNALCCCSRDLV